MGIVQFAFAPNFSQPIIMALKVLASSFAIAQAGITWTQEDCGTDADHGKPDLDTLVLDPPNPDLGETVTVTLTTKYDKELTQLNAHTTVEGLPIPAQTSDGCAGIDKDLPLGLGHISIPAPGCPIAVGPQTTTATLKLSTSFPAVKASTKTVITDQDGEQVSCSILHFQVTKDE